MKKKILAIALCSFLVVLGHADAKDKKWQDSNTNFLIWEKIIFVDLVDGETEKYGGEIGWISPELSQLAQSKKEKTEPQEESAKENQDSEMQEADSARGQEEERSVFQQTLDAEAEKERAVAEATGEEVELLGFDAAQAQWQEQAKKKWGKKITFIPFTRVMNTLEVKAPQINWQELWKKEEPVIFWERASHYLGADFADGILYGKLDFFGESSTYIPPQTRSVQVQQGGTFKNGTYRPRYVTQYYTTGGYDQATWNALGRFTLFKMDGTPVWIYEKYSNKPQKAWFRTTKEEGFFSGYFSRMMDELPFSENPKPVKADRDELG